MSPPLKKLSKSKSEEDSNKKVEESSNLEQVESAAVLADSQVAEPIKETVQEEQEPPTKKPSDVSINFIFYFFTQIN